MVFFLVSGYIITQVVQSETPAVFAIKRAFRIYPLYIFACLLEWGVALAQGQAQPLEWHVRVAQWLLIGDFVGAPYTLGAVEWTLRVELLFYVFMAVVARLGVLRRPALAVAVYGLVALALYATAPWPRHAGWSDGYVNLYFPMLLMGSCVYLAQHGTAALRLGAAATVAGMLMLSVLHTAQIQPRWSNHHFMQLALAVFLLAWLGRRHIRLGAFGMLLSDLSYAVYLMHNWLWDTLKAPAQAVAHAPWAVNALVLLQLFAVCWLAMRCVERPGIRLGRRLAGAFVKRYGV
jgi:peptidoglycan/LPS O-acetylase OafA/YrhL